MPSNFCKRSMTETRNPLAELLNLLFSRLKRENIIFALLRNYEELPERVENDIDIWVPKECGQKFDEILLECAASVGWHKVSRHPRFGFKSDDFFCFNKPFNTLHIDCWHEIRWRNIKISDDLVFIQHLQEWRSKFSILSPGVEASISLIIGLIYKGAVKEKYKQKIIDNSKKDKTGFMAALKKPYGTKLANEIFSAAACGDWDWLEKKRDYMILILVLRAIWKKPLSQIRQWFIYIKCFIIQYLHPRTGLFVVLIGPDGSGKTTTADMLLKSDVKRFFSSMLYYHGHFPFLPALSALPILRKNRHPQTYKSVGNYTMHPFRAVVYPLYYGFNFFLGHLKVWRMRARYGFIIFDRYFYDYLLQHIYARCPRWIIHAIMRVIPKPDVLIYLKCAPEMIHARKPELSIEEIQQQQQVCDSLAQKLASVAIVRTTSLADTLEKVQIIIAEALRARQK